jgi:DNA mismatch endonuclease (patch repair protein)
MRRRDNTRSYERHIPAKSELSQICKPWAVTGGSRNSKLPIMEDPDVTPERSFLMSRVHSKHTKPEMIVRRLTHSLAYRFRLHRSDLPGSPDLVFPRLRKVLFVHGCFWHRHEDCPRTTVPKTRAKFWRKKFTANRTRDRRNVQALRSMGWKAEVIWECETRDLAALRRKIREFLGRPKRR